MIHNDSLLQNATDIITMCDDFITKCDVYYKMRRLLQIATVQKAKKTQTSMKLRKVHQQMTEFSLMKIHQLLQIRL